ncbi:DUF2513 domain-containing protein [Robertmurraya siralis]|uniref:DUF2513 domain-containing protein n=1 Tax=Robertmurraya siralis TaxID=77777 RepID=UPI001476A462|nr:DUF2513 domain-containing protein [Robertmurraya siralis]
MKRDLNLFKDILINLENHPKSEFIGKFNLDGIDKEFLDHHLELMRDAYLIKGEFFYADNRLTWSSLKITNDGYDFLENAKNDKVWKRALEVVKEKGGNVSLEVFKEILKQSAKIMFFG